MNNSLQIHASNRTVRLGGHQIIGKLPAQVLRQGTHVQGHYMPVLLGGFHQRQVCFALVLYNVNICFI